jgi:CheY-like chemotaxis protein
LPRSGTKLVLSSTLANERFLLAEDDPLISMDLQQVLEDEGAMVFPASSVTQALRLVQTPALSAAVIGIKLRTENAEPVCDALSERQVPFIFYTACPDRLSNRWSAAPLVSKPAPDSVIIGALKYVLCADKHDVLLPPAERGDAPNLIAIDQCIVEGEERISRISRIIARVKVGGFDTSAAESFMRR